MPWWGLETGKGCPGAPAWLEHHDARLAASIEYPIVHTHSASTHQLDGLLSIPNLAIQVSEDTMARYAWSDLLRKYQEIQERGHALVLHLTREHFEEALTKLSPRGLALVASQ